MLNLRLFCHDLTIEVPLLLDDILGHNLALSHKQHRLGGVRLLQSNVLGLRLLIKARINNQLLSVVRYMEHG